MQKSCLFPIEIETDWPEWPTYRHCRRALRSEYFFHLAGGGIEAMTNQEIAHQLRAHATALSGSGHSLYRVRAFRQAAMAILGLTDEVQAIVNRSGVAGLEAIPGIGASLAETLALYVETGHWQPRTEVQRPRTQGHAISLANSA
jgi:DNA polymerase (family 10)